MTSLCHFTFCPLWTLFPFIQLFIHSENICCIPTNCYTARYGLLGAFCDFSLFLFLVPFCQSFLLILLPLLPAFSVEFSSRVCVQSFFYFFSILAAIIAYLLTNSISVYLSLSFPLITYPNFIGQLDLHTIQIQHTQYV